MDASRRDVAWPSILAPGADPGAPWASIGDAIGLDALGSAFPVASVVAVAVAVGGFLWLLRETWRGRVPTSIVLTLAVAFHVALVFEPLLVSRDVYSYIAHGQIVSVHGANPYVATPADFPGLLTRELVGPKWADTPSVYGPLFSHLAGVVTRTSDQLDVLVDAFRLLAIAASLATSFVIGAIVRRVRPERAAFAVAAFAVNPVILFQSAASGHNDLLVALAIAVGAWLALRDRTMWAVAVLTCAGLIKATAFLPALLVVVWATWRRPERELRTLVAHAGVGVAIGVVLAAPFFQLEDPSLGMLELAGHEGWLAPSRFFGRVLDAVSGDALGAVARLAFAIGVVVATLLLVRTVARAASSGAPRSELTAAWGWSLLALTLLGPVLLPWYLAWTLPLAWLLPAVPRAVLVALSAILALSQWTAEPFRYPDAYSVSVIVGRYALTPVVIGLLVWLALDLRRRVAGAAPLGDEEGEAPEAREGRGSHRDPQVVQP